MDILTSDEVLEAIKEFSHTAKGRAEIKQRKKGDREFIPKYYNKKEVFRTIKQMYAAAEDMANILYKHIVNDTVTTGVDADGHRYEREGLSKFRREDIRVDYPYTYLGDGEYRMKITIDRGALHRDSLLDNNDGINDILSLFVHGYDSKRSVHGEWHGMEIWTPTHKDANPDFLNNAINEFNQKYKAKATAFLYKDYKS